MKNVLIRDFLVLAVIAALTCLSAHAGAAIVKIDSMTPSGSSSSRITTSTTITSLTAGGSSFGYLVGPTDVLDSTPNGTGTVYGFRGTADDSDPFPNYDQALQGKDVTTALSNAGTFRVMFGRNIYDVDGASTLPDVFVSEIGVPLQTGDSFTVRAITGGTIDNPEYGPLTASASGYAGTGDGAAFVVLERNDNSGMQYDIRGFGLDLGDDLGVQRVIGLELFTDGGDPNLVMAQGVVPEPATLLVWSLLAGLGIGLGWRRRR